VNEARSLADLLWRRVAATPDLRAFSFPRGDGWAHLTWREVGDEVRALACGLRALGLKHEQRCALLSTTRMEWILADLAILGAGGATTTIYPSSTAEDCAFIVEDSGSVIVFAEDEGQLAKLRSQARLADLKVVLLTGKGPGALTLEELKEEGRAWDRAHPGEYEKVVAAVSSDSLATLVYTSGTTGRPKGVELTHDCWLYEAWAIDELKLLTRDDVQYLWLPLSHIFGKVLEAAQIRIGFPTAVDGRVERMVDNLAVVRPTFVAAVPRVFDKVHNKIVLGAREAGGLKLRIFKWALEVGKRISAARQKGEEPDVLTGLQGRVADRLVFSKVRARFGGRLRFFISGSAPLSRQIAEFFHACGIFIGEGYGLTETSAASFVNRPERYRFGTVGLPLPGTEVKIAADGEILIRGRGVMRGYHNLPEATRETLEDGWFHTGDIGELDADGFLRITDRKKDLIKTSNGKYVAPQAIEGRLKAMCPYVAQVVVHGNNRNFCSALVTLDEESVKAWARAQGLPEQDLAGQVPVKALIQRYVDDMNEGLATFESVKMFAILPTDLTVESGLLTPSMKVRRRAVEERYAATLDAFYADAVARL
jgi:long-chain acyl-CoA synthetase